MEQYQGIIGGRLVNPQGDQPLARLYWDNTDRIIPFEEPLDPNVRIFDASGLLVCPGFINLHIHGGRGYDTMQATHESLAAIAAYQAAQGVTAFLPTTVAAPPPALLAVAQTIRDYRQNPALGAEVLGLHLEGPYLAAEKTGAQNPDHLRSPDWDEFITLQNTSSQGVKILAMAPEQDPQAGFIQRVAATGVTVSAAHTNASYAITRRAIEAGLSHATHIFNAMSRFDYRTPQILEALLEDCQITLEMIPDCTELPHLHPLAIRLLRRIAGVKRLCTITDANAAAGMPDGEYDLGGLAVIKRGDIAFLRDPWERDGTVSLAGSVLEMNIAVRNLVQQCEFSLPEAVQTASLNPARVLGLSGERGSLEPGKLADITVLNPNNYTVLLTVVRGRTVYESQIESIL